MPLNNSSKFVVAILAIAAAWYLLDENRYRTVGDKLKTTYNNLMSDDVTAPVAPAAETSQPIESFNNYFRTIEHMDEEQEAGSSVPVAEETVVVEDEGSFQPQDDSAYLFNAEDSYGASNVDGETVQATNVTTEYNSSDYLPQEVNDQWFNTDFSQAEQNIKDQEMIDTRKFSFGVNTVGQSLKNPTYDLRGTIPNPKFQVSAWNNSSYEADYNIRSWCEG